jgi:streptogramin lyase
VGRGLVRGPRLAALLACALGGCRCGSSSETAEAPPAIAAPALALAHLDPVDDPSGAVHLAVGGMAFGSPRPGPLGTCGAPGGASFLELSDGSGAVLQVASTGPEVVTWRDGEVVLALPPSTPLARVRACTPAGASAPAAVERWAYDHVAVPPPGPPLAVAVDGAGNVWVVSEFDHTLKRLAPGSQQMEVIDVPHGPGPGAFSNTLFGVEAQTWFSASNEDAVLDPQGRVWFGQAGFSPIPGPAPSFPDHSRIVAYDPVGAAFRVYNVPGDRNGVTGIAWDSTRGRVWITEIERKTEGFFPVVALPARLASFDPEGIAPDDQFEFTSSATCAPGPSGQPGSCSNRAARPCLRDSDCVLAEQVCAPGGGDDSACWHEYPLPPELGSFQPAHIQVDGGGAVWFAAYWGGNAVGRLDPESGAFDLFRLPAPEARAGCSTQGCSCLCAAGDPTCIACDSYCCQLLFLDSGPWSLALGPGGDLWFTEYFNAAVGRLPPGAAGDSTCRAAGASPCVQQWIVPGVDHPHQTVHSLAVDASGRVWFTEGGGQDVPADAATVGFALPDGGGLRLFPPLSLFPFASDGTNCREAGHFVSFNGAGIAVDPATGEIWFADYCRRRLGRLTRLP